MTDRSTPQKRRDFEILDALHVTELLQAANSVLYNSQGEILPAQGCNGNLWIVGSYRYSPGGGGGFSRGGYAADRTSADFSGYILVAETREHVRGQIFVGFVNDTFDVLEPSGKGHAPTEMGITYLDGTYLEVPPHTELKWVKNALNGPGLKEIARKQIESAIAAMVLRKQQSEYGHI
ncbi:hypothetical protein [Streptomyces sp. NBC_01615]|uniref:hypothetical protein n=1 Tax=Streptomyces sp. NBC_01615 TaxID=2975898 RepID=UPI00386D944C